VRGLSRRLREEGPHGDDVAASASELTSATTLAVGYMPPQMGTILPGEEHERHEGEREQLRNCADAQADES
jgi:hypothetical protein